MRRYLSVFLAFVMTISLIACGGASGKTSSKLESQEFPFYFCAVDNESTINLYFADENHDIPYLDTDTVKGLMERIYHEIDNDDEFALSVETEGNKTIFTRENGHSMELDCDEDVIRFSDYNAFLMPSYSPTVIDISEHYGWIPYLKAIEESSYSIYGGEVCFDLANYGIDLIEENGKCYIPMQTFSDLITSLGSYTNFLYNKQAVFSNELSSSGEYGIFEKYLGVEPGNSVRSQALVEFSYQELCMILDYCYGLKEQHNIESFDNFFEETGLKERLLDEDMLEYASALAELFYLYIDDGHSYLLARSWNMEKGTLPQPDYGHSVSQFLYFNEEFMQIRSEFYPDGMPGYEEIGNTAYITFDSFNTMPEDVDYYTNPPVADTTDAVGLCLYAFSQITREGSPVENVVLDMSCNNGGDTTTGSFVISMFIEEAPMCIEDTLTGACTSEIFRCDANLDGKFDEKDSLRNYNLFCLTSPCSFSCGNLLPAVLQGSESVKIVGQTSGGGTCIVLPVTTADGLYYCVSSNRRMSYMKNGSVYDIDQGVEPDYPIAKISNFYDRDKLTDYINSIY